MFGYLYAILNIVFRNYIFILFKVKNIRFGVVIDTDITHGTLMEN